MPNNPTSIKARSGHAFGHGVAGLDGSRHSRLDRLGDDHSIYYQEEPERLFVSTGAKNVQDPSEGGIFALIKAKFLLSCEYPCTAILQEP